MKKFRGVLLKNANEIGIMKEANEIGVRILDAMEAAVKPGVPTMLFEEIAQKLCREYGVRPAFQGYHGFPYALCCSVNEVVVHGFPSETLILQEGDLVSFDMGVEFQGFYSDSARTIPVGEVDDDCARLLEVTKQCLMKGIEQARCGNSLKDVCSAIQKYVAPYNFGIIRRFVGHGIGRSLHEKPEIPNYISPLFSDVPLKAGMVLAIEPMLALGTADVDILEDNWTAVTRDRKKAAHFEHSVAVTSDGPLILSQIG